MNAWAEEYCIRGSSSFFGGYRHTRCNLIIMATEPFGLYFCNVLFGIVDGASVLERWRCALLSAIGCPPTWAERDLSRLEGRASARSVASSLAGGKAFRRQFFV